jgi:hypothetical protein
VEVSLSIQDLTAKGAKNAKKQARKQTTEKVELSADVSSDSLLALFASWR